MAILDVDWFSYLLNQEMYRDYDGACQQMYNNHNLGLRSVGEPVGEPTLEKARTKHLAQPCLN